jgi:hypothetical protein
MREIQLQYSGLSASDIEPHLDEIAKQITSALHRLEKAGGPGYPATDSLLECATVADFNIALRQLYAWANLHRVRLT